MQRPVALVSVLVLIFAAGCNTLPAGSTRSVITSATTRVSSRQGSAYLLRGWRGLWSEGIDKLGAELVAAGVDARVFRADQAGELGDAIVERYRCGPARPLVLIGFSYGADDAIELARKLDRAGIRIDLLVTIDPVTPPAVPAGVLACRNYYQPNGIWDIFPWLRGIPLEHIDGPGPAARVVNVNIRDRPDLLEPGTCHATIAGNAKLHRAIIQDVLHLCSDRQ